MGKNTYTVVAAIVVVVIVVAAAWYMWGNDGDEDSGDTYYFYMDGFGSDDGWYTGVSDNIADAFIEALDGSDLEVSVGSNGWVDVEDYEGTWETDDEGNFYGTGIAIYSYVSTDVSNYDASYFVKGDTLTTVTSNIVYISFGEYFMDGITFETTYYTNPTVNSEIALGGPFTDDDYQPLDYSGTFYFYLDGFGEGVDGWYSASADDIVSAFTSAMEAATIGVEVSGGWVTFDDYESSYFTDEAGNYYGTGISIFGYVSSDTSNYDSSYFALAGNLSTLASNIAYISFGEYFMDGITFETTYYINPTVNSEIALGGPFA